MNIEFQRIDIKDIRIQWPLFLTSWRSQYRDHWLAAFEHLSSQVHGVCWWLAFANGAPVGGLQVETPQQLLPTRLTLSWIANVWVQPAFRGHRIATRLTAHVLRNGGHPHYRWGLTTPRANEPKNLYSGLGFEPVAPDSMMMVLEREHPTPFRSDVKVEVRSTDIGAIAEIVGYRHHVRTPSGWLVSRVSDPEELVVKRIASNSNLGSIEVREKIGFTCAAWLHDNCDEKWVAVRSYPEASQGDAAKCLEGFRL